MISCAIKEIRKKDEKGKFSVPEDIRRNSYTAKRIV